MSGIPCSDPRGIGCTKTSTPTIFMRGAPHDPKRRAPCQSCRYWIRLHEREQAGLPPIRRGKGRGAL